jgi:hypothetical protein
MAKQTGVRFHRGICPNCGRAQRAIVKAEYLPELEELDENGLGMWALNEYRILECGGCETVYFQDRHQFSEDYEDDGQGHAIHPWTERHYPPLESTTKPAWVEGLPPELVPVMNEVYRALDAELPILAASGMRTALDTAIERLDVDAALTFADKIEALEKSGYIGDTEKRTLKYLTDAGSSAIHRGWRPAPEDLNAIRESLEIFLRRTFIADQALAKLQEKLPPRKRRQDS